MARRLISSCYFRLREEGKFMSEQDQKLLKKIAKLESLCDQLQSEMNYLDRLLVEVGFEEGLKTLKAAALELIEKKQRPGEN